MSTDSKNGDPFTQSGEKIVPGVRPRELWPSFLLRRLVAWLNSIVLSDVVVVVVL